MINKIQRISIPIFFIISIYTVTIYLDKINLFKINTISIEGNKFLELNEIKEIFNKKIEYYNLLKIDIDEMQKTMNNNPFIKATKIYKVIPSKLIIEIKEIKPLAMYQINNSIYFIDNDLNKIKANNESLNFFNVPVLTNVKNEFKNYVEVLEIIKNRNEKFYNTINEIIVNKNNIEILISGNTKIILDNKKKLYSANKLLSFIETIKNKKNINEYRYVDLTVPNQIIVRENTKI